jgi:hypothetical protein
MSPDRPFCRQQIRGACMRQGNVECPRLTGPGAAVTNRADDHAAVPCATPPRGSRPFLSARISPALPSILSQKNEKKCFSFSEYLPPLPVLLSSLPSVGPFRPCAAISKHRLPHSYTPLFLHPSQPMPAQQSCIMCKMTVFILAINPII